MIESALAVVRCMQFTTKPRYKRMASLKRAPKYLISLEYRTRCATQVEIGNSILSRVIVLTTTLRVHMTCCSWSWHRVPATIADPPSGTVRSISPRNSALLAAVEGSIQSYAPSPSSSQLPPSACVGSHCAPKGRLTGSDAGQKGQVRPASLFRSDDAARCLLVLVSSSHDFSMRVYTVEFGE